MTYGPRMILHSALRSVTMVAALLLATFPMHASAESSLKIVTASSPPMNYLENGEVVGFATRLVREGLSRMGYAADIEILPWKRAVFMTQEGMADAIYYAVKNPQREAFLVFPEEPLINESTVMIKRLGEIVKVSPDRYDHRGYRLGVGRGFYYGPKLRRFLERARFAKVEEVADARMNFNKLLDNRIDLALADLNLARHLLTDAKYRGKIEIVARPDGVPVVFDSVDSYLAFSKSQDAERLAQAFSEALRSMKADGSYQRIVAERR